MRRLSDKLNLNALRYLLRPASERTRYAMHYRHSGRRIGIGLRERSIVAKRE